MVAKTEKLDFFIASIYICTIVNRSIPGVKNKEKDRKVINWATNYD
jgi:hypothetical protein